MRFVGYVPATVRGMKVEWDVEVDLTQEQLRALHPQDAAILRVGRLRRPFLVEASKGGGRGKAAPGERPEVAHAKGALVFVFPDDSYFLIEAD
jgi:hypothetical protein